MQGSKCLRQYAPTGRAVATAAIQGLSGKIPTGKNTVASYRLGRNLNEGDHPA